MNAIFQSPRGQLLSAYRALSNQGANAESIVRAGLSCSADTVTMFACPESSAGAARRRVLLRLTNNLAGIPSTVPSGFDGIFYLGVLDELGRARGWMLMGANDQIPFTTLELGGPGMEQIELTQSPARSRLFEDGRGPDFSRVNGAMAERAFNVLHDQTHVVISGCGRLGGSVAQVLAKDAVCKFTLIDADLMERHNLAGGLVGGPEHLGLPKVDVLRDVLVAGNPECVVECVPASITSWRVPECVGRSDVVVSCADQPFARLCAGALACLYHKPLLDVGTGVFENQGVRTAGADIRLVWPGRCLLCCGGVRDAAEAHRILASAESEQAFRASPMDWRQQRAGSLTSLNATAAGVATQMLQQFVEGTLTENGAWTRLQFDGAGLRVTHLHVPHAPSDCLCAFAGLGDDGLKPMWEWLRQNHLRHEIA